MSKELLTAATKFMTLPTKTVTVVDYEALIKTLESGPVLLSKKDHPAIKSLYLQAQRQGAGKLSVKTVHLIGGGQCLDGFIVTLKLPSGL